jgi:L-ribulose-5-phosphate 3-epimerase UlaE
MKIGFIQGRLLASEKKNIIQFFPSKNWKKEIKIAIKNKINLIEWTVNLENIKKNPIYNEKILRELIEFKKNNNIKIHSVTCDFFMQSPFYKLKSNKDKIKNLEILKKVIVNGQKIGIQLFVLPLVDNSSIKNFNQERELIATLNNKIFFKLLKKKSKILFESDYIPSKIIKFIKKFNLQKFGINYDTGNSACHNYNVSEEKIYFKYVKNIHIKDRLKNGPSVRLGSGNWDYLRFFNILKKIKYNNNLILQTARAKNGNHVEEINYSKKFILNLL